MELDAQADTPLTRLTPPLLCGVEQEVRGSAVIKEGGRTSSLIGTQPLSKEAGSLHPDGAGPPGARSALRLNKNLY